MSEFDNSKVTNMNTFDKIDINILGINTPNLKHLIHILLNSENISYLPDISKFNSSNVINKSYMLCKWSEIESLQIFKIGINYIFDKCFSL